MVDAQVLDYWAKTITKSEVNCVWRPMCVRAYIMLGAVCRVKRYGRRCRQVCDCAHGLRCHHVTGDCEQCPPGFVLPACNKRTNTPDFVL